MPLFHGKGARPFKFKFELSDVRVHLNSSSSVAVAVDNVSLTWERGPRSVSSKKGRVVEKLNSVTGELSRTAPLLGSDLVLPATLFRTGSDEAGRWGSKTSEFKLFDADAEEEEAPAPVTSGVSMLGVSSAGAGGTLSQSAAAVGRRAAPPVRLLRQPLRLMPGPPNLGLSRHAKHWPQSSPVAGVITGTLCGADTVRAGGSAPLLPSPAASEPRPRRVAGGDSV
jgi:hypothetical protein